MVDRVVHGVVSIEPDHGSRQEVEHLHEYESCAATSGQRAGGPLVGEAVTPRLH